MKLLILINFCLAVNLVSCENLSSSVSKSEDNELQRKVLKLDLQNGQIRKENAELRIENANLRLELLSTQEREKQLQEANELTYMNCSILTNNTEIISGSLKTLWENVHSFNSYVNDKMAEFATTIGKTAKTPKNGESNQLFAPLMVDEKLFEVACDANKANGSWTVIQRRMNGETNFYRPWEQYRAGFGSMDAEFFIGLDNLHILTTCVSQELLIEIENFNNEKRHAKYDLFEVGDERDSYALKELGTYSGDAGDSLSYHKSQKFSTFDRDNDVSSDNCAQTNKGAWWYGSCLESDLNGEYKNVAENAIYWKDFSGALKFVEVKIRPKNN